MQMKPWQYTSALAAAALLALSAPVHAQYQFFSFDGPVVGDTEAYGINDSGLISVQYVDANGNYQILTLQNGVQTQITVPNSVTGFVGAPNNSGQIPVGYFDSNGNGHAGILQNGNFTPIPDVNGYAITAANAISDNGKIAGFTTNDPTAETGSGFSYIGGVTSIINVPGAAFTAIYGINNAGVMVGGYAGASPTAPYNGFTYNGTNFTTVNYPGAYSTLIYGINNAGDIVGRYRAQPNGNLSGFTDINGNFSTLDFPDATDTWLTYMNGDTGALTGYYSDDDGATIHGFYALVVPEPGQSALLFAMSASGALLLRRKRAR